MNKISTYISHSRNEIKKVIFPTKQQVKQSFVAVIIVVAFVSTFLALIGLVMKSVLGSIL